MRASGHVSYHKFLKGLGFMMCDELPQDSKYLLLTFDHLLHVFGVGYCRESEDFLWRFFLWSAIFFFSLFQFQGEVIHELLV